MRPALEYASSIWLPLASSTSINKLKFMQNAVLRAATGCTQDAPSATPTHTTYTISSPATTHAPRCHHWICGQTLLNQWSCLTNGRISWLVDHHRDHRTPPPPPLTRVKGVVRQHQLCLFLMDIASAVSRKNHYNMICVIKNYIWQHCE